MKFIELLSASPLIKTIGLALVHSLWQGTILAALCGIAVKLLRGKSSNLRYIVAYCILWLMLILPVSTALLSDRKSQTNNSSATVSRTISGSQETPTNFAEPFNNDAAEKMISAARLEKSDSRFLPWFALVWAFGVFVSALKLFGVWTYTERLRRQCEKRISGQFHDSIQRLTNRLRVSKPVEIFEFSLVRVPTVIGWLKPIILLPPCALTGLTASQIELILAHELAHIRRNDYLFNALQMIAETLLFYHPAAWRISRQIRTERENACDDLAVAASGASAVVYARALTTLEKLRRKTASSLAMAADGSDKNSLESRVRRLLGIESPPTKRLAGIWTAIFIGTFLFAVGVSSQFVSSGDTNFTVAARENFQDSNKELAKKLRSSAVSERADVICSLGKKQETFAIPLLIDFLSDDENSGAPVGCWDSGDWSPRLEVFQNPSPGEEAAIALASFGEKSFQPLVESLKNPNPVARRNAAWAIGELHDGDKINRQPVLELLILLLKDNDASVRRAAAFALSEIKDLHTSGALINAVGDENAEVREMAANALGEMKAANAINVLRATALNDKDRRVRSMANWAIGEIQER